MRVGVVTRGKYGERLIETIKERTDFEVVSIEIPQALPEFIEAPEEFLDGLGLDPEFFSSELIITYSLHPDITPEIATRAGKGGAEAVIVPGGSGGRGRSQSCRRSPTVTGSTSRSTRSAAPSIPAASRRWTPSPRSSAGPCWRWRWRMGG
jgi:hypothetical protein